MVAIDTGMNIDEVRALGEQLRNASTELNRILQLVQTKLGSTSWLGPDSSRFKNECWPNHRQRLQRITTDLNEFGQSALNNANEQEQASNAGGGTGGGTGGIGDRVGIDDPVFACLLSMSPRTYRVGLVATIRLR